MRGSSLPLLFSIFFLNSLVSYVVLFRLFYTVDRDISAIAELTLAPISKATSRIALNSALSSALSFGVAIHDLPSAYCETGIIETLVRILKAPIASTKDLSTLGLAFDTLTQAVLQPLSTIASSSSPLQSPSSLSSSPSTSRLPTVSSGGIQSVLKDLSVVLTDSMLLSLFKNPRPSRTKNSTSKKSTYLNGYENMLLSPLWHGQGQGQGQGQIDRYRGASHNYMNEDETELVHAVLVTQTAFLLFLRSYILLSLKSQSSSSKYLDLSACSIVLADVVSDESRISRHRALAADALEHMIALSVREVSIILPSPGISRRLVILFLIPSFSLFCSLLLFSTLFFSVLFSCAFLSLVLTPFYHSTD